MKLQKLTTQCSRKNIRSKKKYFVTNQHCIFFVKCCINLAHNSITLTIWSEPFQYQFVY